MGKSSPSVPTPPDPVKTAEAQAAANKETAIAQSQLNMVDQYTPYGSLVYSQIANSGPQFNQTGYDAAMQAYQKQLDAYNSSKSNLGWGGNRGGNFNNRNMPTAPNINDFYTAGSDVPRYSATTTLSPEQQAILDLTQKAQTQYGTISNTQLDNLSGLLSKPLDYSSLGTAPVANEATRQSVLDSTLARLQPQQDRDRAAMETRLSNQGISYGSDAWMRAMDDFNRSVTDSRLAANSYAGSEMEREFNLASQARNQLINEMIQQRQIPLNELSAMLSGTQVQSPNFVNTPQTSIGQTPLADSIYGSYNGQMNAYNAQLQASQASNQGLFGLLGTGALAYATNPAAFAFSDIRLKRDISRIGTLASGLGLYRFRYIWGGPLRTGVMAQEVQRVKPWAVKSFGGFLAVNYAEV